MKGKICLKGVEIQAYHGCMEEEKYIGNIYHIDISLYVKNINLWPTDNINHTTDYAEIYRVLQQETKKRSQLIERVSYNIAKNILNTFSNIVKVKVCVKKKYPPLVGKIDHMSASVKLKKG